MDDQKGPGAGEGAERLSKEAAKDIAVVAKGGAVQVVGQVTQRGLSFFFGAIATRVLGYSGYGLYRLVQQVVTNLAQLALLGFNYAAMRFIAKARASKDLGAVRGTMRIALTGVVIASIVVMTATLLMTSRIADLFADNEENFDDLVRLIRIAVPYIGLFAVLQVLRYCTQAYKTMVPSVMSGNVIQPAVRFILGSALLLAGAEITGALWTLQVSVVVAIFAAAWWLRRLLTEAERAAVVKYRLGEILRFALPQAGASLLGVQTLGIGLLMLGHYGSDFDVGLFAVALQLQGPGNVFLGGIVNIWAPVVSDLYDRGEIERLGSLYQTINRWIATFSFPVFAALIIEGDLFVKLFSSSEAGDAATVVAILALGNIFYTGTGPTGYVISMTGHPTVNLINSIVAVALYIVVGAMVVPDHGAVGMAWVDAGVTALINSVRVVQAKVLVGVQPFGRTFYKPVVATVAGAATLLLWRSMFGETVWLGIAGIGVGTVVYLGALRLLGLDEEERFVFDRIRKRVR